MNAQFKGWEINTKDGEKKSVITGKIDIGEPTLIAISISKGENNIKRDLEKSMYISERYFSLVDIDYVESILLQVLQIRAMHVQR